MRKIFTASKQNENIKLTSKVYDCKLGVTSAVRGEEGKTEEAEERRGDVKMRAEENERGAKQKDETRQKHRGGMRRSGKPKDIFNLTSETTNPQKREQEKQFILKLKGRKIQPKKRGWRAKVERHKGWKKSRNSRQKKEKTNECDEEVERVKKSQTHEGRMRIVAFWPISSPV